MFCFCFCFLLVFFLLLFVCFVFCFLFFSTCNFHMVEGARNFSGVSFVMALIPFKRSPPSRSNRLLRAPLPNAITLGSGFNVWILGGHKQSFYSTIILHCYMHMLAATVWETVMSPYGLRWSSKKLLFLNYSITLCVFLHLQK